MDKYALEAEILQQRETSVDIDRLNARVFLDGARDMAIRERILMAQHPAYIVAVTESGHCLTKVSQEKCCHKTVLSRCDGCPYGD